MNPELARQHCETALAMAENSDVNDTEKAAMLADIGSGLMRAPGSTDEIRYAVRLFERALTLTPRGGLEAGRMQVLLAGACQHLEADTADGADVPLQRARELLETGLETLREHEQGLQLGELADAELTLGLVLQALSATGRVPMQAAINAYQRALRDFNPAAFPAEYAIVQNNLAAAWLSLTTGGKQDRMHEALAVQAFEAGLAAIRADKHPAEYAMLQNNLGNALQYAASGHALANNLRALEAYGEALRLRDPRHAPLPCANTLANRANCWRNLPDDQERPEQGNPRNLEHALEDYRRARELFRCAGDAGKVSMIDEAIAETEAMIHELPMAAAGHG